MVKEKYHQQIKKFVWFNIISNVFIVNEVDEKCVPKKFFLYVELI